MTEPTADQRWLGDLGLRETAGGPHDLERPCELLRRLGDPHLAMPTVHVAGTRGKGSTCALVAHALTRAGFRTGLTTSPHLVEPTERIRLGGHDISAGDFWPLIARVRSASKDLEPGYFEVVTAAAFLAFAEAPVDVAVIEVGLGGRLDATNLVAPLVTGITRLGLDHRDRLGPTRADIAREKAGILKGGTRAVLGLNLPEAVDVVARRARELDAPLRVLTDEDVARAPASCLAGDAQRENAAVAWTLLEELGRAQPRLLVSRAVAEEAFLTVRWPARLESLLGALGSGEVDLLLDVAHDVDSVGALVRHVQATRGPEAIVFACLADKDLDGITHVLSSAEATRSAIYFTPRLGSWRSRPPEEVTRALRSAGLAAHDCAGGVSEALARAAAAATAERRGERPLVAAFGSFVLAGDVLRALADTDTPAS